MKFVYILLLILSLGTINIIKAQEIPNPGFEEWFPGFWNMNPVGWLTQNNQLLETAIRDSLSFSGEYAMKVYPINLFDDEGIAETSFLLTFIPSSINFYAKWNNASPGGIDVEVVFYNDATSLGNAIWTPDVDSSSWTIISVPIEIVYDEVTHARLIVRVSDEGFDYYQRWISVDDFSFGIIDGVESFDQSQISISPNPCNNLLSIKATDIIKPDDQIFIFDSMGRVIHSGNYQQTIDTSSFSEGTYYLKIETSSGILHQKFQVIR